MGGKHLQKFLSVFTLHMKLLSCSTICLQWILRPFEGKDTSQIFQVHARTLVIVNKQFVNEIWVLRQVNQTRIFPSLSQMKNAQRKIDPSQSVRQPQRRTFLLQQSIACFFRSRSQNAALPGVAPIEQCLLLPFARNEVQSCSIVKNWSKIAT